MGVTLLRSGGPPLHPICRRWSFRWTRRKADASTEMPTDATLESATEKAEALAHQHSTEAYILKPVRKVAPKRDVVTTDL